MSPIHASLHPPSHPSSSRSATQSSPFTQPVPLSLYIHLPWCVRKCPYCDFNSHPQRGPLPEKAYIEALLIELEAACVEVASRPLISVFIGGGTPSLFSAESIERLLQGVRALYAWVPDIEITLEANPGTVEQQKFVDFRQAGINRLSIGIQSFNDESLRRLGRIHNQKEAFRAVEAAHAAGFTRLNLDLMVGLPQQSVADALHDIANAIALEPSHLSHYQLTLEPNTIFYKYPPTVPEEDVIETMQQHSRQRLHTAGFIQYEVSAFAKANDVCRHNLNYWQFGDYIGVGAGAHGKWTEPERALVRRYNNIKSPREYMHRMKTTGTARGDSQVLTTDDLIAEFMLNALRLIDGVPVTLFTERTGLPLAILEPALQQAERKGLLTLTERIMPTELGYRFLNDLLLLFMPTVSQVAESLPESQRKCVVVG